MSILLFQYLLQVNHLQKTIFVTVVQQKYVEFFELVMKKEAEDANKAVGRKVMDFLKFHLLYDLEGFLLPLFGQGYGYGIVEDGKALNINEDFLAARTVTANQVRLRLNSR